MNNKKALIIIDMQKGSFYQGVERYDAKGVVERINKISSTFRNLNYPVIFIQHDGTGTGEFKKNTHEWEILDELEIKVSDFKIDKYANDVFYKSKLDETLKIKNIKELFFTGCATDFCVDSTIQSAITKEYNVTVVEDGHTTGNRFQLNAKTIIEYYNWKWKNMIPIKREISVKKTTEIIKNIDTVDNMV
ncbi:isochorismatase family protein [Aureivirga sp. CE67]|uniref:isochorismatase family protein n=1 Tax=Aureivirga sp. CE67 TaxID=1788983 RepID=UPI0018CAD8ED|nr:isochorismatase family protein [Aureivirga sp. CE67]